MTAPVRIEAGAWNDLRFATLARLLGFADADHALIKVSKIWSWQTEHYTPESPTYVVDADIVESALGVGGAAALVRARLADEVPEGIRIRGSVGRIEWLHQRRDAAVKGGEARKRSAARKTKPSGSAVGYPGEEPKPSPLPLTLALPPEIEDLSPAREAPAPAAAAAPAAPKPYVPLPGDPESPEMLERRAIAAEILRELEAARARAAAALGVDVKPLLMFDPGKRALSEMLRSASTLADRTVLVAQLKHAIAAAEAETTARENALEWFTGAIFAPANLRRLASKPLDASARPRAGPRGVAAPEPVRRIKTL